MEITWKGGKFEDTRLAVVCAILHEYNQSVPGCDRRPLRLAQGDQRGRCSVHHCAGV